MRQIALEKGGWCLSTGYVNNYTKLWWQCAKGHIWEAVPYAVKGRTWCPVCGGSKRLEIEDICTLAKKRNGKCLSTKYLNARKKLKWQCEYGHIWEAQPGNVKNQGAWCPVCNEIEKTKRLTAHKLTIEEFDKIAEQYMGRCLSTKYVNNCTKLKFECEEKHVWEATPANIKKGAWCPVCSQSKREVFCRKSFEKLFNKAFPKRRPDWLINPNTGWRLELDGYCKELNLAFEHNGEQHYTSKNPFFRKNRTLEQQQQIDELKRKVCCDKGIILIEIPYTIKYDKMSDYIISECEKNGIQSPVEKDVMIK